jgi:hypothetical protein
MDGISQTKILPKNLEKLWKYNNEIIGTPVRLLKYGLGFKQKTEKQHFLIACMPKSGSTYFSTILEGLPNVHRRDLSGGYGRREQELEPLRLIFNHSANYVSQLHIRCSDQNENLIEYFGIKPVVLVRNIFDIVVSLRDHFRNESVEGSMGYAYQYMADWDNEDLEYYLANMFIPWYFNFFLTWKNSKLGYFETYENLISDPNSVVFRLLEKYDFEYSSAEVAGAIALAGVVETRRNVGRTGRGEALSETVKGHILKMASFYKKDDFSLLGIE